MFKKTVIENSVWRVEVAPALGADISSLKYKGVDVYVPLETEEQLSVNPYLHGSPILMPANRTAGGKFTFQGREYSLPVNEPRTGAHLHGLVHKQEFTVIKQSGSSVKLRFENRGEIYPFPFELTAEYSAEEETFYQRYEIKNIGNSDMPFTFALHTTFCEPEFFSVPIDSCQEKDGFHIPTGRYVPLNSEEREYASGTVSRGKEISGYYRLSGNTAKIGDFEYTASDNFDHWILFNGKGTSGLLCIEPQCGKVNGLNSDDGCRVLRPGEALPFFTTMKRLTR